MSALYASANGIRITAASLSIPFYGLWVADVTLATSQLLAAPVVLTMGNLTLRGAVLRQRDFAGNTTARLVGGSGGWARPVTLAPYAKPQGVPLSLVLRDAAQACGESVALATDRSLGAFYVPGAGVPAGTILRSLAGAEWYVDELGITQVRARASTPITTEAEVTHYAGGKGWLSVATEDLASWQPGATFTGATVAVPFTVAASRIMAENDGTLRLEVLTT